MNTRFHHLFPLIAIFVLVPFILGQAGRSSSIEARYEKARHTYRNLVGAGGRITDPAPWLRCIKTLQGILADDHHHQVADRCLFLIGQSYHHLYDRFANKTYFAKALQAYRRLTRDYPKSRLADDAQFLQGILYEKRDPMQAYLEFVKVSTFYPRGDMAQRAKARARKLEQQICPSRPDKGSGEADTNENRAPGPALLKQVHHWSTEDYTRVVFYFSKPVTFRQHALPPDPKHHQPARIYLDFNHCRLSPRLNHRFDIADGFLQDVRIGQYRPGQARAVLDIDSIETHNIFTLANPVRIVIDVRGKQRRPALTRNQIAPPKSTPSLVQQLGLGVRCIVVDPGHGGKDKGAIGPDGIYEKTITLQIARRLKKILEKRTHCRVILTRNSDRFVSLEERTAIANTHKADLFVSIHTNANVNHSVHGTETYFLNLSTDRESARVAAFENATSAKKISDLEAILKDLLRNTKISESARLAHDVHRRLVRTLKKHYKGMRDLGVKQAPFYVLLGAEMPSVLIETAFISNRREERLLRQKQFQQRLARGIADGISAYVEEMKRTAALAGGAS